MTREEISDRKTTKKVPVTRKTPAFKWQVQMLRLTSNPKQTLKEKSGGEVPLFLSRGPSRLRRRHRAISFKGFLEGPRGRHLLRRSNRNRLADAQQHDDFPVKIRAATAISIQAYDRSTSTLL
jgi:hypothetical protein